MTLPGNLGGRLARFASFNVGQHLWLGVLSLVATPVLYHRLGEDAYGILALVNLVAGPLSLLEFGFGHATVRRLSSYLGSNDEEELSRTLTTSMWAFVAPAVVGALIMLGSAGFLIERYFVVPADLRDTGTAALQIGAIFFAASIMGNLASSVWQGLQRFGYLNLAGAITATLQLVGSIVLVVAGFDVLDLLWWTTFLGLGALGVHYVWLRRHFPALRLFGAPDRVAFREMASFGVLLMLAGFFVQFYLSGGALVLGHYVAVGVLPFFTVPLGLHQRLSRMASGISAALYPLVAELDGIRDEPSIRRIFVSGTRILTLLGVAAMGPAILLATPFLTLWMGADFARGGGRVLELLFLAVAVALVTIAPGEVARGTGRAKLLVVAAAILAGVNIVGVLLLAPTMGPVGAAIAFVAGQAASSAFVLLRVGGASCLHVVDRRFLTLVAGGVAGTLVGLGLPPDLGVRLAAAVLLGGVLAGLSLGWALTAEEKVTLRRMAGRT